MAKRQGLDDIIRDAINNTRPKRITGPYKFNKVVGDVASDPLSSIQRPRRRAMSPRQKKDYKKKMLPTRPKSFGVPKKKKNY